MKTIGKMLLKIIFYPPLFIVGSILGFTRQLYLYCFKRDKCIKTEYGDYILKNEYEKI